MRLINRKLRVGIETWKGGKLKIEFIDGSWSREVDFGFFSLFLGKGKNAS